MRLKEGESAPLLATARAGSFGKYELCAKLGSGGQAEVYLALMHGQAGFNKLVVIKKLRGEASDDPLPVNRFLDEARLAARLNHPNIVHTYEVGGDGGEYFIAMEYLEGQPMNRMARKPNARKNFTPAMWAKVASEALRGLGYAHNLTDYDGTPLGIVHRDISPDNLFLTYDGEIKVVDFGIAKALLNNEKTETGTLKGKVSYMAPEQVRGPVDRRADLFAMGVVLWEFFTGRKLFEGERGSVLYRLMTDPIPSILVEYPDVDARVAVIIDRALQRDPADRFQTAEDMRGALEEFIRTSGEVVPDVQLGKAVREIFVETRQRVQRQVQAAIARARPSAAAVDEDIEIMIGAFSPSSSLPEIGSMTPQEKSSPWEGKSTRSLPRIGMRSDTMSAFDQTSAPISTTPMNVQAVPSAPPPPMMSVVSGEKRRRLGLYAMLGVTVVAVAVAVFIALRPGTPPIAAAPPPPKLAPVGIASDPPGANVELDGVALGHTPGHFDLTPGRHTLTVTLDDYKTESIVVEATPSPTSHTIVLKPRPAAQPAPATPNVTVKPEEGTGDAPREEVAKAPPPEPPAPSPQRNPQRNTQRANASHNRAPAAPPRAKETAAPSPAGPPRVKAIEDDPKRKIDIIND